MKKIVLTCFLAGMFLLTGCGQGDSLTRYADMDSVRMLDTKSEMKEAAEKIQPRDSGKWTYRMENILAVADKEKKIRDACQSGSYRVSSSAEDLDKEGGVSAGIWLENARQGRDPQEEGFRGYELYIDITNKSALEELLKKMEGIGFSCLKEYSSGKWSGEGWSGTSDGFRILIYEEEDEEESGWPYQVCISVPDIMAFGPEKYFDLCDACMENGWFVLDLTCLGGAVDELHFEGKENNMRMLVRDDKIVELKMEIPKTDKGRLLLGNEGKGLLELAVRMSGDRNASLSFVKDLTSGKKEGTLGDKNWMLKYYGQGEVDDEVMDCYLLTIE